MDFSPDYSVCAMDCEENLYLSSSFRNNQPGAEELAALLCGCLDQHPNLNTILIALESTSVYNKQYDRTGSQLLFDYLSEIYEQKPVILNTNLEFSQ